MRLSSMIIVPCALALMSSWAVAGPVTNADVESPITRGLYAGSADLQGAFDPDSDNSYLYDIFAYLFARSTGVGTSDSTSDSSSGNDGGSNNTGGNNDSGGLPVVVAADPPIGDPLPEPWSIALVGLALGTLAWVRRRPRDRRDNGSPQRRGTPLFTSETDWQARGR